MKASDALLFFISLMLHRRLMDSFQQWRSKAQERKEFRLLTAAAYELRFVHLGRQVLAAFREAVKFGKQVNIPAQDSLSAPSESWSGVESFQMDTIYCKYNRKFVFHLLSSFVFVCLFFNAVLTVPILVFRNLYPEIEALSRYTIITSINLIALTLFYYTGTRTFGKNNHQFFPNSISNASVSDFQYLPLGFVFIPGLIPS